MVKLSDIILNIGLGYMAYAILFFNNLEWLLRWIISIMILIFAIMLKVTKQ